MAFGLSGIQSSREQIASLTQSSTAISTVLSTGASREQLPPRPTDTQLFEAYLVQKYFDGKPFDEKEVWEVKSIDEREAKRYEQSHNNFSRSSITALPGVLPSIASEDSEPDGRMTKEKWLAAIALAMAYTTAFQQGSTTGSIIKSIDEKLGPTNYYQWIYGAGTIANSVALPLAGGLSDIFGRRWFFIVGTCFTMVGAVIALAAQNVPTVIAGMIVCGFGGGSQQLATAGISEIVPNKHRGVVQAGLSISIAPWTLFAPLIGGAIVTYQKDGLNFRINFLLTAILNCISIIMAYFWYHPPAKGAKLGGRTKRQALAELDWIGLFLLLLVITLILVPISLGGEQMPWNSVVVITLFCLGGASLIAFILWEWKFAKNPFMAHELFSGKTRTFTTVLFIDFIAGMGLYASLVFWAYTIKGVFGGSPIEVGIYSMPGGFGLAVGGALGGFLIGRHPIFKTNLCLLYGCLCKTLGDAIVTQLNPNSYALCLGSSFLAMFGTGWTTVAIVVCVQLACRDVDIGLASLLVGSIRAIGGSAAIALFQAILENYLNAHAGIDVAKVTLPLNIPLASLKPLILSLVDDESDPVTAMASAPGITPDMVVAAEDALQLSFTKAFKNVYLCSMGFGLASILAALLTKDMSKNMTNNVAVKLENERSRTAGRDDA